MGACYTCKRIYGEPLPYCSERCAKYDRAYVAACTPQPGDPAWSAASDPKALSNARRRLAAWDRRAGEPSDVRLVDWMAKLAGEASMRYGETA